MSVDCTIRVGVSEEEGIPGPKDRIVIKTEFPEINMGYEDIKLELTGPSYDQGTYIIVNCQELKQAVDVAYEAITSGLS